MQRRAGAQPRARSVGRGISSTLPPGAARFLAGQRLVVASSIGPDGRVWASLLTGPAGFVEAVGPKLLRLAAQPLAGDPLAGNLAARWELGLLVFDPRTRERMRFNGRGLLSPEGISLQRHVQHPGQPGRLPPGGAAVRRLRDRRPPPADRRGARRVGSGGDVHGRGAARDAGRQPAAARSRRVLAGQPPAVTPGRGRHLKHGA